MSSAFDERRVPPDIAVAEAAFMSAEPVAASHLPEGVPVLDSRTLFQGGRTATIHHNGEIYRLQHTRQGKLILTK